MLEIQLGGWTLLEYFWYFVVFSFAGWLLEVVYYAWKERRFVNRGFLFGPFCPIYGLGTVAFLRIANGLIRPAPMDNLLFLLQVFVIVTLVTTLMELAAGGLLEILFDQRWWDYSDCKWNLMGYICARFSLYWGVGGTVAYLFLVGLDLHDGFAGGSPGLTYGAYLLSAYFVADITKSVDLAFRLKIFLRELAEAADDLRERVLDFNLGELRLEATIRRGRLEEYLSEIQMKLGHLTGEPRKAIEVAVHRYASLLQKERINPFRHFIHAFPRLRYRRMDDALDIVRERFFVSRVLRRMEQRRSTRPLKPRIGRMADAPAAPSRADLGPALAARQLVALEEHPGHWGMQLLEVEPNKTMSPQSNRGPRIYVVLEGRGRALFSGQAHAMEKGHYLFTPDPTELEIRNIGPGTLVLLSVLSDDRDLG